LKEKTRTKIRNGVFPERFLKDTLISFLTYNFHKTADIAYQDLGTELSDFGISKKESPAEDS
jgi:hypothetical protein